MEIKISMPGLDDKGYFKYAEESALFFSMLKNPALHTPAEINTAREGLVRRVIVPEGESEKKYRKKVRKIINEYSFNELLELVTSPAEPDPK